ncbi:uncharacterized protein LOC144632049 [Oculina patagonica]
MEIIKVIVVILAVFLHRGNGRAITSANNDNIIRLLGIVDEELNTALNETNEKPTEPGENQGDVFRLAEPDLPSQEALQSFGDDVSGESAVNATPVWRHKRSPVELDDEPECYTGKRKLVKLASGGSMSYPICRQVAILTACSSSITPNNSNMRKCVGSNLVTVIEDQGNMNVSVAIPTRCSCAPP